MDFELNILKNKKVKLFLHRLNNEGNNYVYLGKVIDVGSDTICLIDKFNKLQVIEKDEIARIEEVN